MSDCQAGARIPATLARPRICAGGWLAHPPLTQHRATGRGVVGTEPVSLLVLGHGSDVQIRLERLGEVGGSADVPLSILAAQPHLPSGTARPKFFHFRFRFRARCARWYPSNCLF